MKSINLIKQRYNYSIILLKELVVTDFKLRYKGSVLGYLWSLLRPLAIFLVLYIVFVKFLKLGTSVPHFAIYLLLGIVLWNFFVEITTGSVSAIVGKGDLLRKINFPKYVIIIATSIAALINLVINFIIIIIFMLLFGANPSWMALLFIPLLIIELLILGLAFGFLLSASFVRYRDIGYIWEVIIQAAFYATPILYPIAMIPLIAQKISLLNPMAQIIQDARYYLVTPETTTSESLGSNFLISILPILFVIVLFVVGALYFRKNSKNFAEDV